MGLAKILIYKERESSNLNLFKQCVPGCSSAQLYNITSPSSYLFNNDIFNFFSK